MKKRHLNKSLAMLLLLMTYYTASQAQLNMTAQYRTRSEYRAGQGTLPVVGDSAAFFTNHRLRIGIGYNTDRLKFYTAFQDVRVWGQDASTISNADGKNFMLHEGWAEIIFSDSTWQKIADNFSLKIGRQEIVYDDARLLGNLDWLQQGRRHDAAVIKWKKKTWMADIGLAFNQFREAKSFNYYNGTPTNPNFTGPVNGTNALSPNYKSFYYLYVNKDLGWGKASVLTFNDDFAKNPLTNKVNTRHTFGGNLAGQALRKIDFNAYGYYQAGKDNKGNTLSAYSYGAGMMALVSRKFSVGPGFDLMSGNNTVKSQYHVDTRTNNSAFDPLYGTPHKFWGLMDYFYVADGYAAFPAAGVGLGNGSSSILSPGLVNAFLKLKYKASDKLSFTLDVHEFWAQNKVANRATVDSTDELSKRLGTEFDFLINWKLTPAINFEGGYAAMIGTPTLDAVKHSGMTGKATTALSNVPVQKLTGHWVYLMINVRTDLLAELNLFRKGQSTKIDELNKKVQELSEKLNQ